MSLDILVARKYKLGNVCIRELDFTAMEVWRTDTSHDDYILKQNLLN